MGNQVHQSETGLATPIAHILVGGYTREMDGHAVGLTSFAATAASAEEVEFTASPPVPLVSPTYLIKHPIKPWLYATGEAANGQVTALSLSAHGSLAVINSVPSGADAGCHLGFDPSGEFVIVAHYSSGAITSYKINSDGSLSDVVDTFSFTGSGPDSQRQDHSYAHQVVVDGSVILVADLGADRIHQVSIDEAGSFSTAAESVRLPAGVGPRHLVVIDDYLVVACELSAELWIAKRVPGGWEETSTVPSSASNTEGRIYPSAIAADGDLIFVANRGVDTVGVFRLDREAGTANRVSEYSTGGTWPRDLVLSEDHVWVANQSSDTISAFSRTAGPENPILDFQIPAASPACLVLIPANGAEA